MTTVPLFGDASAFGEAFGDASALPPLYGHSEAEGRVLFRTVCHEQRTIAMACPEPTCQFPACSTAGWWPRAAPAAQCPKLWPCERVKQRALVLRHPAYILPATITWGYIWPHHRSISLARLIEIWTPLSTWWHDIGGDIPTNSVKSRSRGRAQLLLPPHLPSYAHTSP